MAEARVIRLVPPQPGEPAPPPLVDERSTMLTRFGPIARPLVAVALRFVRMPVESVERIRALAASGTIVYVMRYRSAIDHLLVNAVLLREGLPLARFAPGMSTVWWRPVRQWFHRYEPRADTRRRASPFCGRAVTSGAPILIFLRNRAVFGRRRSALAEARFGPRFLREVVRAGAEAATAVHLVPLAIVRGGTGYRRRESRVATLLYSVQDAPGEAKRLFSYVWNRGQAQLVTGREVALAEVLAEAPGEADDRLARRLARMLQIRLYREERVVQGPALHSPREVREIVLRDAEIARLTRRLANERGVPRRKVVAEARGYVKEMAARFNGLYFGILEFLFNQVWPRVFSGLEITGLERVIERMKEHPVVLVPCHRSHFDYLILTYIFHINYLSPPHIAAGINLSFWPMGPLFRGAGAFFIRRTFDDNELYKMVFRKYLTFLIREGYTQEFFIEGGRARTGKMLAPKLGMLSAIVNAFVSGVRQDLYLVPVSIHYGRIPEEEAYRREMAGEEKPRESLRALLSARSILSRRYGTAYVSYAEPISLTDTLGPLLDRFRIGQAEAEVEEEKRRFIQRLGFRLLREVNEVAVAGATSVSATALLGGPRPACRLEDFLMAAHTLTELLRLQRVRLTESLIRNEASHFREGLTWLETGGLIARVVDSDGTVLHVPPEKRLVLDFYKNNTIHFFLVPALVTRALRAGVPESDLEADVLWWLDLYRWEFPLPERETVRRDIQRWLAYYRETGAVVGDRPDAAHPVMQVTCGLLENFREAYLVAARAITAEKEWPIAQASLVQRMQRQFATSLLLAEVTKPEAGTIVIFGNALARFAELGHVTLARPEGSRERGVERGPRFDRLPDVIQRLRI
jgi:glycerol-3-phosphate O-acyltransferase